MRRGFRGLPTVDLVLGPALLALKLVTLAAGMQPGSGVVSYLAAPFWTLPLVWRSRFPLTVAATVAATSAVEVAVGGYHDSVVAIAALVLVSYSLGAHAASALRLLVGLATVTASGIWTSSVQGRLHLTTVLGDAAVIYGPALAGLWVRQQRLRSDALAALAVHLEREREERARTAVAEERTRIARELHDEIAHAMSVIAVQADAAEGALARDPALVERPLVAIRETARAALVDMRRVLGALRDSDDEEITVGPGLARAAALIEQARAAGLDVEVRVEGDPAPLPPPVDVAAYRVIQEGLTNVRKHAAARKAKIAISYGRGSLDVEVLDDGDGSGAGGGGGNGLTGLRERVALLGGNFAAGPATEGFMLRVTLPLS